MDEVKVWKSLDSSIRAICKSAKDTLWVNEHTTVVEELQWAQIEINGKYTDIMEYPKFKITKHKV